MKSFAFILNPVTSRQLKSVWRASRILPDAAVNALFKNKRPFAFAHVKGITSAQGASIDGFLIACPMLYERPQELDEQFVLDKVITCAKLAERLGAEIVGLDGYASVIADKHDVEITKALKIPLTTGNPLITWCMFEALYRVAKQRGLDLKKVLISVVGASHAPGSLFVKKISEHANRLIITGQHTQRLESLKEELSHIEITIESDAHLAVKDADIVVNAGRSVWTAFNIADLKTSALVFDLSLSAVLMRKAAMRRDVRVISTGLIRLAFERNLTYTFGLPKGVIHAPMAEAILLAFEQKYMEHCLGDEINFDKIEAIADISARHGFEVWVPEAPVL